MPSKTTLIAFELFSDDEGIYFADKAYKDQEAIALIDHHAQYPPEGILKVFLNISEFDDWFIGFGPRQTFKEDNWLYRQYNYSFDRKRRKDFYRRAKTLATI